MNLSIIIPVYETEKYLQKCFDSLLPLANILAIEIIFVNDGSPDGSLSILTKFQSQYDFVKIINQENQGLSAARNVGISIAQGNYFILLDSDDWVNPDAIVALFNRATQNQLDLLGFQLQFVDEQFKVGTTSQKHALPYEKIITGAEALIEGYQPSSACVFMYKTTFIINNELAFFRGIMQEDVEFTIRMLIRAHKVCFTALVAYNYYRRSDSMTTTLLKERKERYLADSIIVAEQIKNNLHTLKPDNAALKSAIEKNYNTVIWNLFWRFLTCPNEVSYQFKTECIADLKSKKLYPIKGSLKSKFQQFTHLLFNSEILFKFVLKSRNFKV